MVHHPAMKAYSLDLREKIVAALRSGMSKAQAARTFGRGGSHFRQTLRTFRRASLFPIYAYSAKGKRTYGSVPGNRGSNTTLLSIA
jgi:transposase